MHSISNIALVAALAYTASAGDAPVVNNNPLGITYSATLPNTGSNAVTGALKIAAAPNGAGANVQLALYNLPDTGSLSYGIYSGRVGKNDDCSAMGAYLNPYGGTTGSSCKNDQAGCAIGDLADKHGGLTISSGGSGTGYFSGNYVDKYLSVQSGSEAFVGKGSFVITDSSGSAIACANFINPEKAVGNSTQTSASSTAANHKATGKSGSGNGNGSGSGSSTSTGGAAVRTAFAGAGVLGLAALLL